VPAPPLGHPHDPYPGIVFDSLPPIARIVVDVLGLVPELPFIPYDPIPRFVLPYRPTPYALALKLGSGEGFPGVEDVVQLADELGRGRDRPSPRGRIGHSGLSRRSGEPSLPSSIRRGRARAGRDEVAGDAVRGAVQAPMRKPPPVHEKVSLRHQSPTLPLGGEESWVALEPSG